MWLALTVSSIGAIVTLGGVLAVRHREQWARQHKIWFVSFAAGVLIAVPLLHLVPESFSMTRHASAGLFAGFVLMHVLDQFVTAKVCNRSEGAERTLGAVALTGIGLHSLLDGVVYSVGFSVDAVTGLLMAVGMVLHEFPEGLVTYTLLLCSGYTARRALLLTIIAASISTPFGTLLSWPFIDRLDPETLGILLAASGGALLYVGACHLLPQTTTARERPPSLALLGGIAVAVVIGLVGH